MGREQKINNPVGVLLLAGVGLFGFAIFAPDAAHRHNGAFFKLAMSSPWRHPFDFPAAWCSLKVILLSIGLFLVIESLGTVLVQRKLKDLALAVFSLQIISLLLFLMGDFCLFKSLL